MDAAVTSGPQHMLALERANRVRLARAALKRKIAAGRVDAAEVVLSCPWEVESMTVSELLMSQKRWGRTRCRKFLQSISLLESKTVGSLTERQRVTLAALLTDQGADLARSTASRLSRVSRTFWERESLVADVQRYRTGAAEAEEPDEKPDHRHDGARDQHELERRRRVFGQVCRPAARLQSSTCLRFSQPSSDEHRDDREQHPDHHRPDRRGQRAAVLQLGADPKPADRTPTHSTRLPTNMITTSRAALSTAGQDAARPLHQRNPRPPERRLNSSRKA